MSTLSVGGGAAWAEGSAEGIGAEHEPDRGADAGQHEQRVPGRRGRHPGQVRRGPQGHGDPSQGRHPLRHPLTGQGEASQSMRARVMLLWDHKDEPSSRGCSISPWFDRPDLIAVPGGSNVAEAS